MRLRRGRLSGRRSDRRTPQRSPATSSRTARRMRWDLESSLPLRGWHRSRVPPLASDLEMPSLMLSLLSCGSHRSGALPRWVPKLPLLECEQREGRSIGCRRRCGELGARLLGRRRLREMVDRAVGAHRFARGGLRCTHLLVCRRRCQPGFRSPRRRRFLLHPTVRSTSLADLAALRRCRRRLALAPRRVERRLHLLARRRCRCGSRRQDHGRRRRSRRRRRVRAAPAPMLLPFPRVRRRRRLLDGDEWRSHRLLASPPPQRRARSTRWSTVAGDTTRCCSASAMRRRAC